MRPAPKASENDDGYEKEIESREIMKVAKKSQLFYNRKEKTFSLETEKRLNFASERFRDFSALRPCTNGRGGRV